MRQLAAIEAHEANTRRPVAVPTGRRTRTIAIAAAFTVLAGAGFIAGHAASLGRLRTADLYATNLTVDVDGPEVVTWDHFQGSGDLDGSPSPTGGTWDVISGPWQYQGSSAVGVTNNSPNALA